MYSSDDSFQIWTCQSLHGPYVFEYENSETVLAFELKRNSSIQNFDKDHIT